MKIVICLLLLLTLLLNYQAVYGQEHVSSFTVIAKRGKIENVTKEYWLYERSQFSGEDQLNFVEPQAKMLVINEKDHTFICRKANTTLGYQLQSSTAPRNTRDSPELNLLTIGPYLSNDTIYVFEDQLALVINPKSLPQNEDYFFYLQFEWEQRLINKQLSFSGDTLFITKEDLYAVEGQQLPTNIIHQSKLFHYDALKSTSFPAGNPRLFFLETNPVKKQIQNLIESIKPLDKEMLREQIKQFLFNHYGHIDRANFEHWLKLHFPQLYTP